MNVVNFGCRLNVAESAAIEALLAGDPRTVVVNTCAVTREAEKDAAAAIRRLARERPDAKIVATGCAVQIDPARWRALPGVARVVGNREKLEPATWTRDGDAAGDIMSVRDFVETAPAPDPNRTREFLEIQQGCDHRCTFCVIPFGRGPSRSVPAGAVVAQARALVAAGCREIVLTGVDITSYGADLPGRPSLGQLARRLLALVPDLPRLRFSSLDPCEIDEDLWRLLAEEPRVMPHLHLSLQSGSDLILKRMKRRHARAQALATIARARALRPGLAIGADLIAGFPTETEALFQETLDFLAEADLPLLHVFPYSERAGTPAARMPAVPVAQRRARAAALREAGAAAAARFRAGLRGARIAVLAERGGEGHSEHFLPVTLAAAAAPGELVAARVTGEAAGRLLAEAL